MVTTLGFNTCRAFLVFHGEGSIPVASITRTVGPLILKGRLCVGGSNRRAKGLLKPRDCTFVHAAGQKGWCAAERETPLGHGCDHALHLARPRDLSEVPHCLCADHCGACYQTSGLLLLLLHLFGLKTTYVCISVWELKNVCVCTARAHRIGNMYASVHKIESMHVSIPGSNLDGERERERESVQLCQKTIIWNHQSMLFECQGSLPLRTVISKSCAIQARKKRLFGLPNSKCLHPSSFFGVGLFCDLLECLATLKNCASPPKFPTRINTLKHWAVCKKSHFVASSRAHPTLFAQSTSTPQNQQVEHYSFRTSSG